MKEHGGVRPGYRLADLIYADDTTLIESPEHIQTWLDCLGLEARAVGLEISVKTEAMVIGASSTPPLPRLLDGTEVPFRDRFKLLGSWLPDTADDVDTRIGLAWAKLHSLNTYWRSKGLGEHRKRMLFKVLVLTVLTYGAEAWTIPSKLAARLDGTVYRMLRQVLNVGFSERPSSESLYHGMPRISDEIRQRRIAFVGHLARTSQVDTALGLAGPQRLGQPGRHILTWPGPEGIPKRVGKPVTNYIQMLLDDLVVPAQFEHRIHSLSRLWTAHAGQDAVEEDCQGAHARPCGQATSPQAEEAF